MVIRLKNNLKLDWCSHQAALLSVKRWHYSRSLPCADLIKIGVWENNIFIGAVIFCRGANNQINKAFGVKINEICELGRVALNKHESPVTQIISIALKMVKKLCPNLKLIVSYADSNRGHLGKIYQAGNWIYLGETDSISNVKYKGKIIHKRQWGYIKNSKNLNGIKPEYVKTLPKYRYVYIFDKGLLPDILKRQKPYPKELRSGLNICSDVALSKGERECKSHQSAPVFEN